MFRKSRYEEIPSPRIMGSEKHYHFFTAGAHGFLGLDKPLDAHGFLRFSSGEA
jgi:hypothetical protein